MPTEKKGAKWGIRIHRKFDPKTIRFEKGSQYVKFDYEFFVDVYKKGVFFVTNAAIQKVIKERQLEKGKRLGRVDFTAARMPKWVYPQTFTPFGYFRAFRGKGLASLVELQVLKDVIKFLGPKRLPNYKFLVGHIDPSEERKAHYRKRQLYIGQALPLKDYYNIVLQQLRAGAKKARQPKPKRKKKKKPKPRKRRK
jgi:hypothetical protein